jgi:hypothetical protein
MAATASGIPSELRRARPRASRDGRRVAHLSFMRDDGLCEAGPRETTSAGAGKRRRVEGNGSGRPARGIRDWALFAHPILPSSAVLSRPQPSSAVPNRPNQRSIPGLTSMFGASQREPTAQDQIPGSLADRGPERNGPQDFRGHQYWANGKSVAEERTPRTATHHRMGQSCPRRIGQLDGHPAGAAAWLVFGSAQHVLAGVGWADDRTSRCHEAQTAMV